MKRETEEKIIYILGNFMKKFLIAALLWAVSFCTLSSIVCPFFEGTNDYSIALTINIIGALVVTVIVCFITDGFENI